MMRSKMMIAVLVCIMLLAGGAGGIQARTEGTWGFESGTLAGWSIVEEDDYIGVTGADEFATPCWGSWMAVLGHPVSARPVGILSVGANTGRSTADSTGSPVLGGAVLQAVQPMLPVPIVSEDRIRREFTANMRQFVFAYNIARAYNISANGLSSNGVAVNGVPGRGYFSYTISTLDGSVIIASGSLAIVDVAGGDRAGVQTMGFVGPSTTGWQVVDVDLSAYLHQQLAVEFALERGSLPATSDNGLLEAQLSLYPTWVYVDVDHQMPIVSVDMMPEVRFIVPIAPGAMVAGTSMDVVIEATDDQSIAEIRLLVNGTLAGSSMTPGRQTFHVSLQEGLNTLQAIATDGSGKQAMVATTVVADSQGPVVTVDPLPPSKTTTKMLSLSGSVEDAGSGVRSLTVAGTSVAPDLTGAFTADVPLVRGVNNIVIEAIDNLGNTTSQTFTVTYHAPVTAPSSIYVLLTIGSRNMEVNGLTRTLDAAPFIKDGRTLLPIRALIEALGGSVQWNASTKTATVLLGSRTVALTIGSKTALVNGTPIALDVAPEIGNGRTFLPLRAVAENLGLDLSWEPISQTISLTYWP
jgi:hypothetical protein